MKITVFGQFVLTQGAATDEHPCPEKHFFFLATKGRCLSEFGFHHSHGC